MQTAHISAPPRHFLPADFTVTTWDALQPYFEALQNRTYPNWNNGWQISVK
jgi:oligoendopeptidase F